MGNSYDFQLQNASHTISLFSCYFSSSAKKQERSGRVMTFLRNHGFTDTQISKIVKASPQVLSANTQKTLLPKIEFLSSIGISSTDIPAVISRTPILLSRSLEEKIVPAYNFLKSLLCDNEKDVAKSIRRDSNILVRVITGTVALNVEFLRQVGLPQSRISLMLLSFPYVAYQSHVKLKRSVEDVIKMGFDPLQVIFILAVHVKCGISKDTWERRMEIYRSWGLSDEEILLGFRKHPFFMHITDENIARTMDVLVNKMGWEAAIIARTPSVLFYNLEKRIIPRCRVIKVLMSKGLVKKTLRPSSFIVQPQERFLDRFVRKYKNDLPELIKIYLGEIDLLEPGFGL